MTGTCSIIRQEPGHINLSTGHSLFPDQFCVIPTGRSERVDINIVDPGCTDTVLSLLYSLEHTG